jgi:acetyl-CoA acyltransferase
MKEAVIVSAVRTAVGKAPRGMYRTTHPEVLAVTAIRGALERAPGLDPAEIDDVMMGCAFPEAEQGLNVGRNYALLAGLPESVPGFTMNRFCSSGLQAIALGAQAVMSGMAEVVLAAGVESMSRVPGGGNKEMFSNDMLDASPDVYLSMGLTAENVASRFNVTREQQDILANLRAVFKKNGTVTAGNSSQTSDGAAAAVVMSAERAAALELKPMARFVSFAAAGCDPAVMGIGPVFAIPKALKLAGLKVSDIDLVELNEAFASQAYYCIHELGFDPAIVNVNGGAIALGHPLGATGAKLTATLLHEMQRRQSRYGVVSMCVAGGIGAAAVFERL